MLDKLKLMLGLSDDDLDNKLTYILDTTASRLKVLLGGIEPPEELEYIIIEVSIIRFNKIGSEGISSQSVEGESLQFSDNDFAGFLDDIQSFLDNKKEIGKGKVKFL